MSIEERLDRIEDLVPQANAHYWRGNHEKAYEIIDDVFSDYDDFWAWYLTESNPEYALFTPAFVNFVRKHMFERMFNALLV